MDDGRWKSGIRNHGLGIRLRIYVLRITHYVLRTLSSIVHRLSSGLRQPGLALAVISFGLGLVWAAAVGPLGAPDEPAHLQAVMQVRKLHILPEVHYVFALDT